MMELAQEMIFCLLSAALLGIFIGYLIGRISKCAEVKSHSIKARTIAGVTQNKPNATLISEKQPSHAIGIRPHGLDEPNEGVADDLKEISGVGLKIEEALNSLGLFHFHQVAEWTQDNIDWVDNYLVFKGRINREDWVAQAKLLALGGHTEFSKKVKNDKVERYR